MVSHSYNTDNDGSLKLLSVFGYIIFSKTERPTNGVCVFGVDIMACSMETYYMVQKHPCYITVITGFLLQKLSLYIHVIMPILLLRKTTVL